MSDDIKLPELPDFDLKGVHVKRWGSTMTTPNTLRGFGFSFERGSIRKWYIDEDGIKRWVDTGKAVEAVTSEVSDELR